MKTYIYTLSDPKTNIIRYVGKTSNPTERIRKHIEFRDSGKRKTHLYSWMKSIVLDPIFEIIDEVDESEWKFWEIYWISQFKTWGFKLTNLTDGGDGGCSIETKEKLRIINTGEGNPMWGKKHKQETIDMIVINRSWYKHSKETIDKISKSKIGHTVSEETREKLRISNTGENSHRWGKENSEHQKKSVSLSISKPIMCIDDGKIFPSIKLACLEYNLSRTQIQYILSGKRKTPILKFVYI